MAGPDTGRQFLPASNFSHPGFVPPVFDFASDRQYIDLMPSEPDLIDGVVQLSNVLHRRTARLFSKASITPQQWTVLSTLDAEAATSVVTVARRLLVSKQSMSGMIVRLEARQLLERTGDPGDLRSWRVRLTRKGRSLVDRLRPSYEEWVGQLEAGIGERDVAAVKRTIARLVQTLSTE